MNAWGLLADAILVSHFAFVLFVIGGLAAIWIGWLCGWQFVRNLRFRLLHLAAMGFVLLETVAGMICPLTVWEDALRVKAGQEAVYSDSFIAHWLGRVLYYELPMWAFTLIYAVCFGLIVLSWMVVRPERRHTSGRAVVMQK